MFFTTRALLGRDEPHEADQVEEGDRDAQPPELVVAVGQLGLHVRDHVLLDEVAQEVAVEVDHQRRGLGQQLADQPAQLLGHLHRGDVVADQRLVHV
jgi:hypothetical protein